MAERQPTALLAIKGAFKHNPARGRERVNEPVPTKGIGPPPKHLTPEQRACWEEIVGLAHPGTLFSTDRLIVEQGAMILDRLRTTQWVVRPEWLVRWEQVLGKLGMTPADRSRVTVAKKKDEREKFQEFLRGQPQQKDDAAA